MERRAFRGVSFVVLGGVYSLPVGRHLGSGLGLTFPNLSSPFQKAGMGGENEFPPDFTPLYFMRKNTEVY